MNHVQPSIKSRYRPLLRHAVLRIRIPTTANGGTNTLKPNPPYTYFDFPIT